MENNNGIALNSIKYYKVEILMAITIFYTNITYLPSLTGNKFIDILNYLFWIVIFFAVTQLKFKINKEVLIFIVLLYLFNMFILIMDLFTSNPYINSRFIYPVNMSIFILYIGFRLGELIKVDSYYLYAKSYIISALILGTVLYLDYFRGVDWINSMSYIFVQKNGIAQIFLIAIAFLLLTQNLFRKNIIVIFTVFFCMILLMLKSRATLLGLFLLIAYIFLNFSLKKKLIFISIVSTLIVIIALNSNIFNVLIYNVLLNNRADTGINAISSGRISHFTEFMNNFGASPLIGQGRYYLESFPLASLMSYGIFGSIILFTLSILPIAIVMKKYKRFDSLKLYKMVTVLWVIMIVNSLFEELAPFGPGVKCYMLWLLCGIYIGHVNNRRIKNNSIKENWANSKL